jgi:hypothetical protein
VRFVSTVARCKSVTPPKIERSFPQKWCKTLCIDDEIEPRYVVFTSVSAVCIKPGHSAPDNSCDASIFRYAIVNGMSYHPAPSGLTEAPSSTRGVVRRPGDAMYRSVARVRAIAEAVAREEHDDLEVKGVTPGEARGGYTEIMIVRRHSRSDASLITIGVDRHLPEAQLRQSISAKLRV